MNIPEEIKEKISKCKGVHYFHTMKTGGTYMRQNLEKLCKLAGIDLVCSSYESGNLPDNKVSDDFLKITSVRDPLEMLASYWEYMKYSSTSYGKSDGGFGDTGWMLGRRTPFKDMSDFMSYFADYADFQYMLSNRDNAWSYTMETGSFFRDSGPKLLDHEEVLIFCSAFRPPLRYFEIKKKIEKWMTDNKSSFWKNPSVSGTIQDSFSYHWWSTSKDEIGVSRLNCISECPWVPFDVVKLFPDHPTTHFILGNFQLGWCSWRPSITSEPQLDRFLGANNPVRSYFNVKDLWHVLLNVWEYQVSPYHKLFKFSNDLNFECCFDIILKQEDLTVGFDALKKMFKVNFDSSEKIKVTHGRRQLKDMMPDHEIDYYNNEFFKRERALFGYDKPQSEGCSIMFGKNIEGFFDKEYPRKLSISGIQEIK